MTKGREENGNAAVGARHASPHQRHRLSLDAIANE